MYIAGGVMGEARLASAEVYDPMFGQWSLIEYMTSARSGLAIVSYRDYIYALGGFDGWKRLSSCENIPDMTCMCNFKISLIPLFSSHDIIMQIFFVWSKVSEEPESS